MLLKRTYILTLKALRQNSHLIHILNICHYKILTYIWNIYHTNFYCSTHIYLYAYWKANYILHTLAFKKDFHAIIHSFRKIIIHTRQGIPCPLYFHIYLRTIEKHFPRYLGAKYQTWGSPNSNKNSHKQVLIFMLFQFYNQILDS